MREQWLTMRNNDNYDVKWLYKYFTDNGGASMDINQFFQVVHLFGLDKICLGLDKTFNITTLSYKETGQIIKYY